MNTKTLSIPEFLSLFYTVRDRVDPTVRLGQMFINLCISDSSSDRMQELWNETNLDKAKYMILEVLGDFQWVSIPTTADRLSTKSNDYFTHMVGKLNA